MPLIKHALCARFGNLGFTSKTDAKLAKRAIWKPDVSWCNVLNVKSSLTNLLVRILNRINSDGSLLVSRNNFGASSPTEQALDDVTLSLLSLVWEEIHGIFFLNNKSPFQLYVFVVVVSPSLPSRRS